MLILRVKKGYAVAFFDYCIIYSYSILVLQNCHRRQPSPSSQNKKTVAVAMATDFFSVAQNPS